MILKAELIKLKQSFPPGKMLFLEGDQSKELYILVSGEVEVIKNGQILTTISEAGVFIGELAALLDLPRTASARISKPSELIVIPSDNFKRVIAMSPDIAMKLINLLARRLKATTDTATDLLSQLEKFRQNEEGKTENSKQRVIRITSRMLCSKFSVSDLGGIIKQLVYKDIIDKYNNNFTLSQRELAVFNKKLENAVSEFDENRAREALMELSSEFEIKSVFIEQLKKKYLTYFADINARLVIEDADAQTKPQKTGS